MGTANELSSGSDMEISVTDVSTDQAAQKESTIGMGDNDEHILLRPPTIEATGKIATGATTPLLRKQNKIRRNEKLLKQPSSSQWQRHHGSTFLPEDHWNQRTRTSAPHEMAPQGLALKHEAADILRDWEQFGCPTATGKDWTINEIRAAIDRGPHKSALEPDAIKHFAEEVADKVAKGQARVVLWDDIKHDHPRQLKISPVAAISHKSRA